MTLRFLGAAQYGLGSIRSEHGRKISAAVVESLCPKTQKLADFGGNVVVGDGPHTQAVLEGAKFRRLCADDKKNGGGRQLANEALFRQRRQCARRDFEIRHLRLRGGV